jgi:hypothetical protein
LHLLLQLDNLHGAAVSYGSKEKRFEGLNRPHYAAQAPK